MYVACSVRGRHEECAHVPSSPPLSKFGLVSTSASPAKFIWLHLRYSMIISWFIVVDDSRGSMGLGTGFFAFFWSVPGFRTLRFIMVLVSDDVSTHMHSDHVSRG